MTRREWQKKLEPYAQMLYDTFVALHDQRHKLEDKIEKDFGAIEAYVSVKNTGIRIHVAEAGGQVFQLKFDFKNKG